MERLFKITAFSNPSFFLASSAIELLIFDLITAKQLLCMIYIVLLWSCVHIQVKLECSIYLDTFTGWWKSLFILWSHGQHNIAKPNVALVVNSCLYCYGYLLFYFLLSLFLSNTLTHRHTHTHTHTNSALDVFIVVYKQIAFSCIYTLEMLIGRGIWWLMGINYWWLYQRCLGSKVIQIWLMFFVVLLFRFIFSHLIFIILSFISLSVLWKTVVLKITLDISDWIYMVL